MDEPSQLSGGSHRTYRHDLESLPIAIKMFEAKYGAEIVENIFLDHLKADGEESRKQKTKAKMDMAWSTEDDDVLLQHFLEKIEVLEPLFSGRYTRKDIRYRQRYLGIIRPRIFRYARAHLERKVCNSFGIQFSIVFIYKLTSVLNTVRVYQNLNAFFSYRL